LEPRKPQAPEEKGWCMMMSDKIKLMIEIEVDQDRLKDADYGIQELLNDIVILPDDFIDGFSITRRNSNYGEIVSAFYMGNNAKIIKREVF
jgi:hypothetical protein